MRDMRNYVLGSILPLLVYASVARGQIGDGYIGVFGDAAGTTPCVTIPEGTARSLYVLGMTSGQSGNGITGAEFRIEITNPNGWYITYSPPMTANITMGSPLDYDPDPDVGGGINLSFPSCQSPIDSIVPLGTMFVYNISGTSTDLLVKRHSTPTNSNYACALFTLCDSPQNTKLCASAVPDPGCTSVQPKPTLSSDETVFRAYVNRPEPDDVLPTPFSERITIFDAELWVVGHQIAGPEVSASFDGSRLAIGGIEIPLAIPQRVIPENELLSAYTASPRFHDFLTGRSVSAAAELFEQEVQTLIAQASIAQLQSGIDAACQVFRDSPLVSDASYDGAVVRYNLHGLGSRQVDFGREPPKVKPLAHHERAHKLINSIKQSLGRDHESPALLVVGAGGGTVLAIGVDATNARLQIDHVRAGGSMTALPTGPFVPGDVLLKDFVPELQKGVR